MNILKKDEIPHIIHLVYRSCVITKRRNSGIRKSTFNNDSIIKPNNLISISIAKDTGKQILHPLNTGSEINTNISYRRHCYSFLKIPISIRHRSAKIMYHICWSKPYYIE